MSPRLGGCEELQPNGAQCEYVLQALTNFEVHPRVKTNNFRTDGDLGFYSAMLGPEFMSSLMALSASQTWIDFGSGKTKAILDYLSSDADMRKKFDFSQQTSFVQNLLRLTQKPLEQRAQTVGVTYSLDRWWPLKKNNKLRLITGKYFEEIDPAQIPEFDLGTDVFGISRYTPYMDHFYRVMLSRLKVGGVYFETQADISTSVILKSGEQISQWRWLSRIRGIEVEYNESTGSVKIKKINDLIVVPRLKLLKRGYEAPPLRIYQEV